MVLIKVRLRSFAQRYRGLGSAGVGAVLGANWIFRYLQRNRATRILSRRRVVEWRKRYLVEGDRASVV